MRHAAEVERTWFRRCLEGDEEAAWLWGAEDDDDFVPVDGADWPADLGVWQAECEHSRGVAGRLGLDDTGLRRGDACSLRWVYVHLIEEYARHNGHADLLRELADGAVGW